jgi:hypothetical protein
MEKRVKEEARSITANCNIKLFGKLEDPTQTKDFFEKTVGQSYVTEVSGFSRGQQGQGGANYADAGNASIQVRARADYDELRSFSEGRAICAFGPGVTEVQVYYSNQGFAKAMRVHRFLPVPPPSADVLNSLKEVKSVLQRLRSKNWQPQEMEPLVDDGPAVHAIIDGYRLGESFKNDVIECSALAITNLADHSGYVSIKDMVEAEDDTTPAEKDAPTEKAEAAKAALEGSAGPLSWMDVIGGDEGEDTASEPSSAPTPQPAQETKPADDGGGVSWDSIMGGGDDGDNTSGTASGAAADKNEADQLFDEIFGGGDSAYKQAEVITDMKAPDTPEPRVDIGDIKLTGNSDNIEAMDWNTIMGLKPAEKSPVPEAPKAPEQKQAEAVLEKPEKPSAPTPDVQQPVETEQGEFNFSDLFKTPEGEDKKPDQDMTWADIIGMDNQDKPSE